MDIDINKVVAEYIMLRDKIDQIKAECDKQIAPIKAAMDNVESMLSGLLERAGLTSMATASGTVVKSKWTKTVLQDWNEFTKYVKDNDRFDLIEHRVAKNNALDVINEDGSLPGVSVETGYTIQIRRK